MNDNSRAGKVDRWKRPARASSYPLMNTRIGNSTLRGGQTVFHGIRMWGQLLRTGMFLAATAVVAVGPMTATALLSTMGDPGMFRNGRECAAWLGLVPRQHSTGGKDRLLGILKRGDRYLRCLVVHGARVMVTQLSRKEKTDRRSQWLKGLLERRHRNVATVALANRMVRTAWAVLASGMPYEENHVPAWG